MELVEYPTSIFDNEDVFLVYFFLLLLRYLVRGVVDDFRGRWEMEWDL
jgi:hypothetical protein